MSVKIVENNVGDMVLRITAEYELEDILCDVSDTVLLNYISNHFSNDDIAELLRHNSKSKIQELFDINDKWLSDYSVSEIISYLIHNADIKDYEIFKKFGFENSKIVADIIEQKRPKGIDAIVGELGLNNMATYEEICTEIKNKFFFKP
ncbi:MAG: hypothetical protein FWC39_10265 [Bacteroidetes bacterium]|nr:hypothetical protein [Bacteroidota bacterium]